MSHQLVFDLAGTPRLDRDDFLVSTANGPAVTLLDSWPHWPSPTMLLIGPPGSGKTHLATIWATDVAATVVSGAIPATLWTQGGRNVVLEDCDRRGVDEAELFHALNLVAETNGSLLMTARTEPAYWGLNTPDVRSRLRLATTIKLAPPDDELITAVLIKLFSDRQLRIDADVVAYAARHCEQSLDALIQFVTAVDGASLATGRRITRPLAMETIASLANNSDGTPSDQGPT